MSARKKIQAGYRSLEVSPDFLGGGTVRDFTLRWDSTLPHNVDMSSFVQLEHWYFPVISTERQTNVSVSVQFSLDHVWERQKLPTTR